MQTLNENHISFDAIGRVNALLAPLKKAAHINFFCYGVNLPDFSGFTFYSNAEYYMGVFQNEYHLRGFSLGEGWTRAPYQAKDEKSFLFNLGIGNLLCYVEHQETMTEIFTFGTPPDVNKIDNFYINNIDYLKSFAQHFTEEFHDIIQTAHQQLVMPTPLMIMSPDPAYAPEFIYDEFTIADFANLLSPRESRCLALIAKGYNHREIAKQFDVSINTIDSDINRLKEKFQVETEIELFQKALQLNLIEYAL